MEQYQEWQDRVSFKRPARDDFLDTITEHARRSTSVCELGAGLGRIEYYLYDKLRDKTPRIVGLEYSQKHRDNAVTLMQKHYPNDRIEFVKGDAFDTGYEDNTFDLVISSGLVEHFDTIRALIAEHVRITKTGGTVIISVPSADTGDYHLRSKFMFPLLAKYHDPAYADWHHYGRRMTVGELQALVRGANVEVLETKHYGESYRLPWELIRIGKNMLRKPTRIRVGDLLRVLVVVLNIPLGFVARLLQRNGHSFFVVCRKH
ncbi:MAG: methyltransferase domain-containing protein [Candidatus Krumholzibacteria bacterium]|nr:methyltransferase domain-containing protein [Candidatus Krumholzibacteria bacterium]